MQLDLLAIETFSFTPHLETAGEVCVSQAMDGGNAGFAFVDVDNPDDLPRRQLFDRLLGDRRARKVAKFERLLASNGVQVVKPPALSQAQKSRAQAFGKERVATFEELKRLTYRGAALGLGAASSLVSRLRDPDPDVPASHAFVSKSLRAAALAFESAQALIGHHRPSTVLVFNGRFACVRAIAEAAAAASVPCMFHERGGSDGRYEVYDRPIHDYAASRDRIRDAWESGGSVRDEVARSFFSRRRAGDGMGWLSYVGIQEKGSAPPHRGRRRLAFFSTSEDEFVAASEYGAYAPFTSQRDAVCFLMNFVSGRDDMELVVRVHPHVSQKSAKERYWWNGLRGSNLVLVPSHSTTDSYALVETADVVLTYGSSIGVEATFARKPVVLLGESDYRELGCAYVPASACELETLLDRQLLPPMPVHTCLPYGYYYTTRGREFRHYRPSGLFHGAFMGVDLSREGSFFPALKRTAAYQHLKSLREQWAR
jgi:hypothetical protein